MKRIIFIRTLILLLFLSNSLFSQQYYKLTSDISVKEKISETQFTLSKGKIEYNKYTDRTVLKFTFPIKETWILSKDSLTRIINGKPDYQIQTAPLHKYSVFRLFLKGTLKNYGLKESLYKIIEIEEKDNSLIYTTWKPEKEIEKFNFGKVVLAQKDNKLYGIVFYDKTEKLISKQIFKDYVNLKGLYFPSKIIQITDTQNGEEYKITEFKNIVLE